MLSSRQEFARWVSVDPDTLTDVQRAARFAYLQRLSFGGKPAHEASPGQMGPSTHHPARLTAERMFQLIEAAHRRLQRVHIERLNWDVFLRRYDRPFTLFYLDPPYWNHEQDYGKGIFAREDFALMAKLLSELKGRCIVSLNDRLRGARAVQRVSDRDRPDPLFGECQKHPAGRRAADQQLT